MLSEKRQEAVEKLSVLPSPRSRYGLGMNSQSIEIPLGVTGGFDYVVNAPKGVQVYTGADLTKAPLEVLNKVNSVAPLSNKVDAFHYSQLNDLVVIHISQGVILDQPIMLNTLLTASCHVQHVLVVAEEGSKAVIVDHQSSDQIDIFYSHVVEVIAHAHSHIDYVSAQSLAPSVTQYARKYGSVDNNATLRWIDNQLGSGFTRLRRHTTLIGENAKSSVYSLALGIRDQLLDIKSTVSHQSPRSISRIITRTALADLSKVLHRANIIIPPGVLDCDGQQHESTLLLSKDARIHAVPMLEISNDAVICSHGSSISCVNEDELFYLMSRGVSSAVAQQMIVEGFFSPVLDILDCPTKYFVQSLIEGQVQVRESYDGTHYSKE